MLLNNYSVIRFIIIISAILSIEFFCYIGSISPLQLTAPSKMVMTLYEFMYEQSFWFQARKTVKIRNPYSTRPWQHVFEAISGYMSLVINLKSKKKNSWGSI